MDYAKLFKAFVIPYLTVYFGSIIGLLWLMDRDLPELLLVLFFGGLGELGFEYGVKKVRKK